MINPLGWRDVFDDGEFLILNSYEAVYKMPPRLTGQAQVILVLLSEKPPRYVTNWHTWQRLVGDNQKPRGDRTQHLHDLGFRYEVVEHGKDGCIIEMTESSLALLVMNYPRE